MLVKITKRAVDALPVGKSISDGEVRGFRARRLPSGKVHFELRYTTEAGLRSWIKLGELGAITPDEARTLAKKRTGEVASGKDPGAHKRDAPQLIVRVARLHQAREPRVAPQVLHLLRLRLRLERDRALEEAVPHRDGMNAAVG